MHYHIQVIGGEKDYEFANTSFAWTLARCAVLAERDGLLRKPFSCSGNVTVCKILNTLNGTNNTNAS